MAQSRTTVAVKGAQGAEGSWIGPWLSLALPIVALAGVFVAVSLATTHSRYLLSDLVGLALLYLCVSAALHLGARFALSIARPVAALAALGVGGVVGFHIRAQTHVPESRVGFFALAAVLALVYGAGLLALPRPRASLAKQGGALLGVVLALCGGLFASYNITNTLRWHVLRHNPLLGIPVYHALAEPVKAVRSRMWGAQKTALLQLPVPDPAAAPRLTQTVAAAAQAIDDAEPEATGAAEPAARARRYPHIVFVLLDTVRADVFAAYGGERSYLPQLNEYADSAIVFSDVVSNASWTRPAVASFFTGELQEVHGAVNHTDKMSDEHQTLAEELKFVGYETAAFVTNVTAVGADAGFGQGFDQYNEVESETGGAYMQAEGLTARVEAYLQGYRESGSDAPLFLYVHYLDPHTPYLSGQEGADATGRAAYDAELRYMDPHVARLLQVVEDGLAAPRAVFVTSDHGEAFREHDVVGHGTSLHWEQVDVPAVLKVDTGRAGARPAPAKLDARLEGRDFFDLMLSLRDDVGLDVAGWAAQRAHETRYLSLYVDMPGSREYLRHMCQRAVERGGRTLVWSGYGDTYELYDKDDPLELSNVFEREPELVARLRQELSHSARPSVKRIQVEISERQQRILRALGYAE